MAAAGLTQDYEQLLQLVESLTHLDGRMRPKTPSRRRDLPTYSQQTQAQREAATWLPKGFVDIPRFEIPLDVHQLEQLTPIQYLNKYCVITSRVKKLLYHRQYTKYREPKIDGIDSLEKVKKALKDVCTFSINTKSFSPSDASLNYYMHGILEYDMSDSIRVNFKTFMGMAALAERMFNPNYMSSWWDNEKQLESDYIVYNKLREKEAALKEKIIEREAEQERLHDQKALEKRRTAKMTLIPHQGSDSIDEEPVKSDSTLVIEVSPSEHVLIQQVQEHRNQLEKKISVTKILELESRPNKCPKEVMEQVDFHGLKWKLKDINVSTNMERLIRIIINL